MSPIRRIEGIDPGAISKAGCTLVDRGTLQPVCEPLKATNSRTLHDRDVPSVKSLLALQWSEATIFVAVPSP